MKKVIVFALSLLIISVTGCKKEAEQNNGENNIHTVGIAKLMPHPALNAVEEGIKDEFKDQKIKVKFDFQNANSDMSIINAIADKFKADKVDVAVGISTPMTLALINSIKDQPIVFAAITDPVAAKIVKDINTGGTNITGTSDAVDIEKQIKDFHSIVPFKKLGIIYTTSEDNAVSMYNTAKKVCEKMGIQLIGQAITSITEIKQAAQSLVDRVDAFYVVTDNTVCSSLSSITETAAAKRIPVFSADPSSSLQFGGVLYTSGADYYMVGRIAGRQIIEILNGKKTADMPVRFVQGIDEVKVVIDKDAADRLGVTIPAELIPKDAVFIEKNNKNTK